VGAGAAARLIEPVLDLVVDEPARGRLPGDRLRRIERRVARMVRAAGLAEAGAGELEVTLRLTDDPTIRELNRVYRRRDRPTDVLAFAQREGEGGALHPGLLGDIVISVETAARQARRGLERELLFLAAHGLCHLLGYDHHTDAEEAEMNARMAALLREAARPGRTRPA
jgi:probable rRNA maturation factor